MRKNTEDMIKETVEVWFRLLQHAEMLQRILTSGGHHNDKERKEMEDLNNDMAQAQALVECWRSQAWNLVTRSLPKRPDLRKEHKDER